MLKVTATDQDKGIGDSIHYSIEGEPLVVADNKLLH